MGTSGWFAIALIALGVITIFRAGKYARDAERRLQSGEDRFFEERREIRAYAQHRDPARIRRGGWAIIASGLVLLALDFFVVS